MISVNLNLLTISVLLNDNAIFTLSLSRADHERTFMLQDNIDEIINCSYS